MEIRELRRFGRSLRRTAVPALAAAAVACADSDPTGGGLAGAPRDPLQSAVCELPDSLLADGGVAPNAIPALTEPDMVRPGDPSLDYLHDESRVLGVVVEGEARAYPHNILWWHEIVNDRVGGHSIGVTLCPLTGSGLVFDRATLRNRPDLGVSGLLFANNLVMYDREQDRLIGPQMSVVGRCGAFAGVEPDLLPVTETSWGRWRELHPATVVVSGDTGHQRDYRIYPYGDYDRKTNPRLFVRMRVDPDRPPKERILGVRGGSSGGVGYPFDELGELGDRAVVHDDVDGRPVAIFWEARQGGTAVAYDRRVDGRTLTFEALGDGYRDTPTGTRWDLAGRAVEGPLAGSRLDGVGEAFVAFWFAWRYFQPDSRTWLR